MNKKAEQWRKVLTMLEAVKVDPKKLKQMEGLISRITSNLEESINRGELPDSRLLYEQQSLAIKLQSTLEDLREGTNELEQLEKRLESFCKDELEEQAQRARELLKRLQSLYKSEDR